MRKITSLFALMLVAIGMSAYADTYTYSVGYATGTFYRYGNECNTPPNAGSSSSAAGSIWASQWKSTTYTSQPELVIECTNGRSFDSQNNGMTAGNSGASYTITAPTGYVISNYVVKGTAITSTLTFTPEGKTAITFAQGVANTATVSEIFTQTTSFSVTGSNNPIRWTEFTVTIIPEDEIPSTVNVTYNLMFNGSIRTSEVVEASEGADAASLIPASMQADFITLTAEPATITSTTTEVNVTATWTGPFEISANVADAHYYYLKMGSSHYPQYTTTGDDNVMNPSTQAMGDEGKWAFVGNPYDGFQIYNKAAGSSVILGSANADPNDGAGRSAHATMQAPGTQAQEVWTVVSTSASGFRLRNGQGYCLSYRSNSDAYLAYWTAGVSNDGIFTVSDANFYDAVVSEIKPFYDNPGTDLFYLTSAGASAMATKLQSVLDAQECSYEDYVALTALLQANVVLPESGKFYRIFNENDKKTPGTMERDYMTVVSSSKYNGATIGLEAARANAGTVLLLSDLDATSQTFSLQGQGRYLAGGGSAQSTLSTMTYHLTAPGIIYLTPGTDMNYVLFVEPNRTEDPYRIVNWYTNEASSTARWQIEEAEDIVLTLNSDGKAEPTYYATMALPFDVVLDANTAYTATLNADNTRVSFTELGVGVPAGTAVLLKGTEASITASIEDASVTFDGDNALVGNYFSKTLEENTQFALGISEGVVGFYPYTDALGANKAYLEATGSSARAFVINFDDVTGISSVEAAKADGQAIYDLQGRRVQNAQKGIYVIGGRKVLVK